MVDDTAEPDPEEIKAFARAMASAMRGGKLIIPKPLAAQLRRIDAWDDETMHEVQDIPS